MHDPDKSYKNCILRLLSLYRDVEQLKQQSEATQHLLQDTVVLKDLQ